MPFLWLCINDWHGALYVKNCCGIKERPYLVEAILRIFIQNKRTDQNFLFDNDKSYGKRERNKCKISLGATSEKGRVAKEKIFLSIVCLRCSD